MKKDEWIRGRSALNWADMRCPVCWRYIRIERAEDEDPKDFHDRIHYLTSGIGQGPAHLCREENTK